jgi:hypothetical protein
VNTLADHDGDSKPIPDPTVLTTEALTREITALNNTVQLQLGALQDRVEDRFSGVDAHFGYIERQRIEQKQDTKAAVEAALSAAKEAVKEQTTSTERAMSKSESDTSEHLKHLRTTFTESIAAVERSVGYSKERITALESIRLGGKENLTGVYALVGVLITIALLGLGILTFLNR